MVINPNGTLFIRHSHKTTNQEGRSGQGAIGIYGLLDVPEGLPDEKQVLAMFQQTPQGIRLDLTDKIFKPGDRQGPTEDHPLYNPLSLRGLGDFATSTMWVDAQPQPQVTQGLVHIYEKPRSQRRRQDASLCWSFRSSGTIPFCICPTSI